MKDNDVGSPEEDVDVVVTVVPTTRDVTSSDIGIRGGSEPGRE